MTSIRKPLEKYQTIQHTLDEVLHVTEPGVYRFYGEDIPVGVDDNTVVCDYYL
jgi:hypothetical protein